MRAWREREDLIECRGAEYRAGLMTEVQFRAYLFGMHLRGEDIQHRLADFAPVPTPPSYEDRRMEASRQWIENYRRRQQS